MHKYKYEHKILKVLSPNAPDRMKWAEEQFNIIGQSGGRVVSVSVPPMEDSGMAFADGTKIPNFILVPLVETSYEEPEEEPEP